MEGRQSKNTTNVWQRLYDAALIKNKNIRDKELRHHDTAFTRPAATTPSKIHNTCKRNDKCRAIFTDKCLQLYDEAMRKIKETNRIRKIQENNEISQEAYDKTHPATTACCNRLYNLSQTKRMKGKQSRETFKGNDKSLKVSNKIQPTTNARCNSLYDLSKTKQIVGKRRREDIMRKSKKRAMRPSYKNNRTKPINEKKATRKYINATSISTPPKRSTSH